MSLVSMRPSKAASSEGTSIDSFRSLESFRLSRSAQCPAWPKPSQIQCCQADPAISLRKPASALVSRGLPSLPREAVSRRPMSVARPREKPVGSERDHRPRRVRPAAGLAARSGHRNPDSRGSNGNPRGHRNDCDSHEVSAELQAVRLKAEATYNPKTV